MKLDLEGRNCQSSLKGTYAFMSPLPQHEFGANKGILPEDFRRAEPVLGYCHSSRFAGLLSSPQMTLHNNSLFSII
ncbi:MAG: hypothetical protein LAP21_20740 [Acidobacteriia bacterium]|nr:hypothetical protein [Terriglobia bacterium]